MIWTVRLFRRQLGDFMRIQFRNAHIFDSGTFRKGHAFFGDGIAFFSFDPRFSQEGVPEITGENIVILPAFVDVHTHLREPGFSYKETIQTGSEAALSSGYRACFSMPNLKPVPDSAENLKVETDLIDRFAAIPVYPYGAITRGEEGKELSDMAGMERAIAFSDDGHGVQNENLMLEAMKKARELGKIIAAHCEDNSLLRGGYIHDGVYAKQHGHRGICSESEWRPIARDIELAKKTGCAYHVCHVSTKESVALIRQAKKDGVDITCETAPHYLVLTEADLQEDGRFKMNPPLRGEADRNALIEGLIDGTIDMIATDHAPHSPEEKARGLEKSAMGVVGLETAFPILYTELVKKGIISLERLVELMSLAPAKRFSLPEEKSYAVYDLGKEYKINPNRFHTKGRATPFEGKSVFGKCVTTVLAGDVRYFAG